jgi:hypothetical protein
LNIKLREATKVLAKLGFIEAGKSKDIIWKYYYKGKYILKTKHSKGRGDIRGKVADKFRTQLKLNEPQFRDAIRCPFQQDDYIRVLMEKGLIN